MCHLKGSGLGGEFKGPTIKSLINNEERLFELLEVIGDQNKEFITHLKDIAKVHEVATRKSLDIDLAKEVLTNFNENWQVLRNKFDLNETLKIHLIKDHMFDYFELTGKTLLRVSDEITEAAHSALRIHDERHGYKILNKGTEQHEKKKNINQLYISTQKI